MIDDARLDARVRSALTDLPAPNETATRDALSSVLDRDGRSSQRVGIHWSWVVPAAAAAAVALVVGLGALVLGPTEHEQPAPSGPTSVAGSWERQVEGADLARWDGVWQMTLSSSGVLTLAGPESAVDSSEGASYSDSGGRLRVDAFVNSVCAELPAGVYAWDRDDNGLVLTLVEDPCPVRADLFAGRWRPAM